VKLSGRIWREDGFWLAEVPMLDALTQGRSEAEALRMLADLVETMADRDGFRATVTRGSENLLEVGSNDPAALASVLLRRQREKHGLSLADVARRLGARSKTAYARYEQGDSVPSVAKFFELLTAVVPGGSFVLEERDGSEATAAGAPVAAEGMAPYGRGARRTRRRPGRRLTPAR
jgi:transcriptional regulator with XRE-family HTH domain